MKTLALIALSLVLTATSAPAAEANVMVKPVCLKSEDVTNKMAPPELYGYAQACLKDGNKQQAAVLFYIATSYAGYDFERVENDKKTDMLKKVGETFSSGQDQDGNMKFGAYLQEQMATPTTMYPICQQIFNVGPPMYEPTYLLDPDLKEGKGYKTEFDIPLAWLNAVGMATLCPVKNLQLDKNYKP